MKKITLITAMESEFSALSHLYDFHPAEDCLQAMVGQTILILKKCGMGKVNAAVAAEKLCLSGADMIVSLGIAGGLDPILRQGDTVISTRVCYHDVWCGEPNLPGQVQDLPPVYQTPTGATFRTTDPTVKTGLIVTGDQFVTDPVALKRIKTTFPDALAVDMESAAIAQTCYLNGCDFVSMRMISDVVGSPEQKEAYEGFWSTWTTELSNRAQSFLSHILEQSS